AAVWSFPSGRQRGPAREALAAGGVDSTAVDHRGGAFLVVAGDAGDEPAGLPAGARRRPDLCLLTVLGADGGSSLLLVSRAEADSRARRSHDLLYPAGPPEPSPPAARAAKRRSPHSGLLIGSPPHQDPGPTESV
ncbi:hypothetical protein GA0115240_129418, partial [Streptomyces sp. DvalAA-14]